MDKTKYKAKDVNWVELESIGISRELLDKTGQMPHFLNGEKTSPVSLHITLLGCDMDIEASLQLTEDNDSPIVSITSLTNEEAEFE